MAIKEIIDSPANDSLTNGANYIGGVAPIAGDVLVVNRSSQAFAGVDLTSTALAGVIVGAGFSGTFGSSGAYVQLDTPFLRYSGQGDNAWVGLQDASGSTVEVDVENTGSASEPTTIAAGASTDFPTGGLRLDTVGSETLTLRVHGGFVSVDNSAAVATAYVGSGGNKGPSTALRTANLWLGSSLTTTTSLDVVEGVCYTRTGFTTESVGGSRGGTLYHDDDDLTTANLWGGSFIWRAAGHTLTTMNAYDGTFDGTRALADWALTTLNKYAATCDLRSRNAYPTVTTINHIGHGTVLVDPDRTIAIT